MIVPRVIVWPPLPLDVYNRRPASRLPWPLEEPTCRLFSRARQGLFAAVKAIGLVPGDEVLVPAYHHGSEIEALARAGLSCRFYDAGENLEPVEDELEDLLTERVRALYLTHYLGLAANAAWWRKWCDERDLLLIEDAAQGWLSRRAGRAIGSHGDVSMFCLYKSFGLADGAAVLCKPPARAAADSARWGGGHLAIRHGSWLAQRWPLVGALRRRFDSRSGYDSSSDFELGDPTRGVFGSTRFLLPRVAAEDASFRRYANYLTLSRELGDSIPEEFPALLHGASPFGFPVATEEKETHLTRLACRGIVALNFWSRAHPSLDPSRYPRATDLRNKIVILPVHQELGSSELRRIIDAVQESTPSLRADQRR